MCENERLIEQFYSAFSERNGEAMKFCYHENATFKDEVFELKGKDEIGAMWIMLTKRARDFSLEFSEIKVNGDIASAKWEARYRFTKTGRMVHNKIQAHFTFKDGLIIQHIDSFDFWKWTRMALGLPGLLLGWSGLLQNKIRQEARYGLEDFLKNN